MKAPYEAYRLLLVRNTYPTDAARRCDECGEPLRRRSPVAVTRLRGRGERRYFHLACFYGLARWRHADRQTLARWAQDLISLERRLALDQDPGAFAALRSLLVAHELAHEGAKRAP